VLFDDDDDDGVDDDDDDDDDDTNVVLLGCSRLSGSSLPMVKDSLVT